LGRVYIELLHTCRLVNGTIERIEFGGEEGLRGSQTLVQIHTASLTSDYPLLKWNSSTPGQNSSECYKGPLTMSAWCLLTAFLVSPGLLLSSQKDPTKADIESCPSVA
jgi:hypothetical protein